MGQPVEPGGAHFLFAVYFLFFMLIYFCLAHDMSPFYFNSRQAVTVRPTNNSIHYFFGFWLKNTKNTYKIGTNRTMEEMNDENRNYF